MTARVTPWAGTAHGVLQAITTYDHHDSVIRGERHTLKTITGDTGRLDRTTWRTLQPLLLAA